ncbi:hypothetical protein [Mesorhizobium sp. M0213]
MALTADFIALVERVEPDPGPEPGTTEHSDAEFDDLVEQLLLEYRRQSALGLCLRLADLDADAGAGSRTLGFVRAVSVPRRQHA